MAQVVVAQRMWQRRDTAANWTAKNPVLAAGELGVQLGAAPTDTKLKIGDGVTAWNDLGFFSSGSSDPNVVTQTSSYTPGLSDDIVLMDSSIGNSFFVPANSEVPFPVGKSIELWQIGDGRTTVVANSGVQINISEDITLRMKNKNSRAFLRKVGLNTWMLSGRMAPPTIYSYQVFSSSGTFNVPAGVTSVDVLAVGGGGGAGYKGSGNLVGSGGGGAGGVVVSTLPVTPGDAVTVTVGAGGAGGLGATSSASTNGGDSVFGSVTAKGGGRSADILLAGPWDGFTGGSGGGGGYTAAGGSGTSLQGFAGGSGGGVFAPAQGGGGGGGASATGANGTGSSGGAGGAGYTLAALGFDDADGVPSAVGGGGGGSAYSTSPAGSGGLGGGGAGANNNGTGANGTPNTGGGGGGAGGASTGSADGGSGGSGIVVVSWPGGRAEPVISALHAETVTL